MSYPQAKRIPIPELGPDAYMVMQNPWTLPMVKPLPKHLRGDDVDEDALDNELRERGKKRFALLIKEWGGVCDAETGEPLPAPADDPEVFDRIPSIIQVKIGQAIQALELDAEWDPTKRLTPPTDPTSQMTSSPSANSPVTSSPDSPASADPDQPTTK